MFARNVLLAASSSAWLRERATKAPFVRRAVSRFMPGERLEDAMLAAREQQAQGVARKTQKIKQKKKSVEGVNELKN